MSGPENNIPARLKEIIEDFEWAEGQEKLELLLQYAEEMPPLPEWLQGKQEAMEQVHECMTPVFVHAQIEAGKMTFQFDIPESAPTVRGYASILGQGLAGATPEQVLSMPNDFFQQMGLERVLTHQRLNGLSALLAHMKALAVKAAAE